MESLKGKLSAVHLELDAKVTSWHELQMYVIFDIFHLLDTGLRYRQAQHLEQTKVIIDFEAGELQRQRKQFISKVLSTQVHPLDFDIKIKRMQLDNHLTTNPTLSVQTQELEYARQQLRSST